MKKSVVLLSIMMSVLSVFAQDYLFVSAAETKDFGHAFGWVVTFNLLIGGALILPFLGKKNLHFTFAIFLALSVWLGYIIMHYYQLSSIKETILFLSCSVPGTMVYVYAVFFTHNVKRTWVVKSQKQINDWTVIMRYLLAKKIHFLIFPFVFVGTYIWSQTPRQLRKKQLRSMGWNVDSPEVFSNYIILHRSKNPLLTCAVSRSWRHVPIGKTRSLGTLSLESQHEIEVLLDYLKLDIARLCEREKLLLDERIIVCGKRSYSPRYMLSKIERKTPLGIRFLHEHLKKIMEESFNQRRLH